MVTRSEPDMQQAINGVKRALGRQKSQFQRDISNVHKLRDLDRIFNELGKVSEAVVKGKFGPLRHRQKIEITSLYPVLEPQGPHSHILMTGGSEGFFWV